jgi:hypothetical protein
MRVLYIKMNYKNFEILKEVKQINHKYDIRTVYKIKTNLWFNSMEFLSINSLYKFIDKEVLK